MNHLSCREALARLYDYLDGELEGKDAEAIQRHLDICRECYPHVNFCRTFQDTIRRAASGQPEAPAELRARILELLRAEGIDR